MTPELITELEKKAADSLRKHLLPWSYDLDESFFDFDGGQFTITGEYDAMNDEVYLTYISVSLDDESEYTFTDEQIRNVEHNYNAS